MALSQFSHGPSKVAKSIRKKKGPGSTSSLHANSRDARKLNRATLRDEKLWKNALDRDRANDKYLQRVSFFKTAAETIQDSASTTTSEPRISEEKPSDSQFNAPLLARLISTYISRNSDELDTLASTRRPGRAASTRELALKTLLEDESSEFASGFWIPDLRDEASREFLCTRWDGGWSSLSRIGFVRVVKPKGMTLDQSKLGQGQDEAMGEAVVRESKFPPKGDS